MAQRSASPEAFPSVRRTTQRGIISFVVVIVLVLLTLAISVFISRELVTHYRHVVRTSSQLSQIRTHSATLTASVDHDTLLAEESNFRLTRSTLNRISEEVQAVELQCIGEYDCGQRLRIIDGLVRYSVDLLSEIEAELSEAPDLVSGTDDASRNATLLVRALRQLVVETGELNDRVTEYWELWSTDFLETYSTVYFGFLTGFATLLLVMLVLGVRVFGRLVVDLDEMGALARQAILSAGRYGASTDAAPVRNREHLEHLEPSKNRAGDEPANSSSPQSDENDEVVLPYIGADSSKRAPYPHYSELMPILASIERTEKEATRATQAVLYGIELEARLQREKAARLEKEKFLHKTRLQMLQMQINPHFLFNTLGLIRRMAEKDAGTVAAGAIERLSQILRYSLDTERLLVPFEDEWDAVAAYVEIQSLRHQDRITFFLENNVETDRYFVPPLTIQPMIENSIEHGFAGGSGSGRITILAEQTPEEYLLITVNDDGVGLGCWESSNDIPTSEGPKSRQRIGLRNILERGQFCYDGDFRFSIRNRTPSGTRAEVLIPPIDEADQS